MIRQFFRNLRNRFEERQNRIRDGRFPVPIVAEFKGYFECPSCGWLWYTSPTDNTIHSTCTGHYKSSSHPETTMIFHPGIL